MISPMLLETMGIERFSPQSEQSRLRLIQVDGPGAAGGELKSTWPGLSEMCWDIAKLAIGDAARILLHHPLSLVRATDSWGRSCASFAGRSFKVSGT